MEKEGGMEERYVVPALQEFPQLSRLHFLSAQNQSVIADYLAYIRAWVAYLGAADIVSRPLPSRLREGNQPVSITRNRWS